MHFLMSALTLSEPTWLPSSSSSALLKKNLSSYTPKGVATYLLVVMRLTVDVDIIGDVFQDKRFEFADPFLKKAALVFNNTFDDLIQCPLPLVQAFDKPRCGTDFFVEVFFFLA